jgi:hypothetical protein
MQVEIWHDRRFVAIVQCKTEEVNIALEYAWRRTNNIDGSWSQGEFFEDGEYNHDYSPDVTVEAPLPVHNGRTYGLRSSMVGDIFIIGSRKFRVAAAGFKEI